MFEWFPRRATEAEVAVARAILDGANDRTAELLLEQFRTSRRVQRHIEGATLRVVVPWTTEDLMVDLDEDVISDPVPVRDVLSGRPLWFRVHLARGGFFRCLEGQGRPRWPRRWDVDPDAVGVGPGDDRRCLFGSEGRLVEVPAHDAAADEFEPAGADLRNWIAGLLDVSNRPG